MQHQIITEEHEGLRLTGVSVAGVATCLLVPEWKLAFDVGPGFGFAIPVPTYLISHGHMDHAGGIPYLISQKALAGLPPGHFYMPAGLVDPLKEILKIWSDIEGHPYQFKLFGVSPGDATRLSPQISFEPFRTVHRIPSQGYTVYRHFRRLRPELSDRPQDEIAELAREGQVVAVEQTEPLLSFTGDTQIEFLDASPAVQKSRILVVETTYAGSAKTPQGAREWGHIHLDELLPRLPKIACRRIVLIHLSTRHTPEDIEKILDEALSPEDRGRVAVFGSGRRGLCPPF